jgi:plasminogen activator inhibitor 1 RNA-binding protein
VPPSHFFKGQRANCIRSGSEKQAAQSWGAADGTAELNDEQAGEAIAQSEQKDAEAEDAEAEAQEPESPQVFTLDTFYAKQAETNAALNVGTSTRKANEGANTDQWGTTQVYIKKGDDDFIAPSKGKKKEQTEQGARTKKESKISIEISHEFKPEERTREGRGGPRGSGGDRGPRGGDRGPRGGADRRGGAPRGPPRGGAPRGGDGFPRGAPRGGRGGSAPINPNDTSAFPSLGSK